MHTVVRIVAIGTLACGMAMGGSTGAYADPKGGEALSLTCGSQTLLVHIAPGNGDYTPALVDGTNQVLVPHAFGEFTGSVYNAQGGLVDSFTEPPSHKGSGKQQGDLTCSYSFDEVSDGSDPEFPAGYRFVGSGTVTGKLAPR